jgi:hypothetical protein
MITCPTVCVHKHFCANIRTFHIHTFTNAHTHTHVHTHVHTHTHTCTHTYTHATHRKASKLQALKKPLPLALIGGGGLAVGALVVWGVVSLVKRGRSKKAETAALAAQGVVAGTKRHIMNYDMYFLTVHLQCKCL